MNNKFLSQLLIYLHKFPKKKKKPVRTYVRIVSHHVIEAKEIIFPVFFIFLWKFLNFYIHYHFWLDLLE